MRKTKKHNSTQKRGLWPEILCTALLFLGLLCFFSSQWYLFMFAGQSFNALLFTLFSGIAGADNDLLESFCRGPLLLSLCCTAFLAFLLCQRGQFRLVVRFFRRRVTVSPVPRRVYCWLCVLVFLALLIPAEEAVGMREWFQDARNYSDLLTQEYIDPAQVQVRFPEKKRNLVYIFMESMENTFCSTAQGGAMKQSVTPELYQLAEENISFSDSDRLGGWGPISCTTWTTSGIVAQTAGLPLLLPMGQNNDGVAARPLQGATMLWDILNQEGYSQAFVMGSSAIFSGMERLFRTHGIDQVYDYDTAADDGIIPTGYRVFWGMEDTKLYTYARQVITQMAQGEEPFQVCVSTIDTHAPGGWCCAECPTEFPTKYENAYACASRQVYRFVEWLKEQPFYENTTVIICGDHLSMAADYFRQNQLEDTNRRVYNCIINSPVSAANTTNREITPFDMFPTTLAAMGCQIQGDRLGLGVNLFSDQPTLAERLGVETLNNEIDRSMVPYLFRFLLNPGSAEGLRKWLNFE